MSARKEAIGAVCATFEVLEILAAARAGKAPPACPWCGAVGPACHYDPANAALMYYCPACGAGFTWVADRPSAVGCCG